jgi:hypothetical protein
LATFCCFAAGENFPGELNGADASVGFFVSVFVDAIDQNEAERKAFEMLSGHPDLTLPDNAGLPGNATITFKVVHELEHHVNPAVTEFKFFDMDG